jgi:hypothetical protein
MTRCDALGVERRSGGGLPIISVMKRVEDCTTIMGVSIMRLGIENLKQEFRQRSE